MPTKTGAPRRYRRRDRRITLGAHDATAAIYVMGRSDTGRRPRVITVTRAPSGIRLFITTVRGTRRLITYAHRVDPDLASVARHATRMVSRTRHTSDLAWPPPPRHIRRILRTCHI
ncbi:hypothetical protein [Streptosporangium sp. NPDC048865]|uniref:hypothetical protein n=1 Tax=Streptosporangium sp. NPDC048865 TaxID=3155766 RepID=UPI003412734B